MSARRFTNPMGNRHSLWAIIVQITRASIAPPSNCSVDAQPLWERGPGDEG